MVLAPSGGGLVWVGAGVSASDVYLPVRGPLHTGTMSWYRITPDALDLGHVAGWDWVLQNGAASAPADNLDPGAMSGGADQQTSQGGDGGGDGGPECPDGCGEAGLVLSRYGAGSLALVAPEAGGFRVVVVSGGMVEDWTDMPDLSGLASFLAETQEGGTSDDTGDSSAGVPGGSGSGAAPAGGTGEPDGAAGK